MDDLKFTVEFTDDNGTWFPLPATLRATPQSWSATALGGPEQAVIRVTGADTALWECLRMLRYGVRILAASGRLLWWGYVNEVNVTAGGTSAGLTLDTMYNSVRVIYTYDDADGAPQDAETGVHTNSESWARYGRKEMLYSIGDADAASAESLRDKFLSLHEWPVVVAETSGRHEASAATLECRGWWNVLEWEYYADATGREVFDAQNGEQTLGWQLTSTEIAFTATDKAIYHNGTAFRALNVGDKMTITGSGGNNGTFEITNSADRNGQRDYTATSIRFGADEEIFDDDPTVGQSGFGFLDKNDFFLVSGSSSGLNDRYWRLNEADADHLVIQKWWGYNIVSQALGPSVTLTRLLKVQVKESVANGYPGATVTIKIPGQKVYMKWTPSTGSWDVAEISVRVWKEGTPSDNMKLELCQNSSGLPGTVLASATVAGSDIGSKATWKKFTLNTPVTVTNGTNYHIVLSRTGSMSSSDYYYTAVDEDLGYSGGSFGLWDGATWITRAVDADMPFQAWGTRSNEQQIEDMLQSHEIVSRADVSTVTGISTRHYRDGRNTVRREIEALIDQGTSSGGIIVAVATVDRTFRVYDAPASSEIDDLLIDGGRLYYADGTPCDRGYVPAGVWARLRGLPSSETYARISPFFIHRTRYDAVQDTWQWEPRGIEDVFAQWGQRQG